MPLKRTGNNLIELIERQSEKKDKFLRRAKFYDHVWAGHLFWSSLNAERWPWINGCQRGILTEAWMCRVSSARRSGGRNGWLFSDSSLKRLRKRSTETLSSLSNCGQQLQRKTRFSKKLVNLFFDHFLYSMMRSFLLPTHIQSKLLSIWPDPSNEKVSHGDASSKSLLEVISHGSDQARISGKAVPD